MKFPFILCSVALFVGSANPAFSQSFMRFGLDFPLPVTQSDAEDGEFDPDVAFVQINSSALRLGVPFVWTPVTNGLGGGGTWSVVEGELPDWATLDDATGVITGTPSGSPELGSAVRLRVSSHLGYVDSNVFALSTENAFIVAAPDIKFRVGQFTSGKVETSGAVIAGFDMLDGPDWLTIDDLGNIHGTTDTIGVSSYSARAWDFDGAFGEATANVEVLDALSFAQQPQDLAVAPNSTAVTAFAVHPSPVNPRYRVVSDSGEGVPAWLSVSGTTVQASPGSDVDLGNLGSFRVAVSELYTAEELMSSPFALSVAKSLEFDNGYLQRMHYAPYNDGYRHSRTTVHPILGAERNCLTSEQGGCRIYVGRTNSQRNALNLSSRSIDHVVSYTVEVDSGYPVNVVFRTTGQVGVRSFTIPANQKSATFTVNRDYNEISIYRDQNGGFYVNKISAVY